MSSNEYVPPPRDKSDTDGDISQPKDKVDNIEYIPPPKEEAQIEDDQISTPRDEELAKEYVQPTREYIPPRPKSSKVTDKTKTAEKKQDGSYREYTKPEMPSSIESYFDTPRMGIRFYLTGYLFIALYYSWIYYQEGKIYTAGIYTLYVLLSNYAYSWYADYRRYKGGFLSWFFRPYGSIDYGRSYNVFDSKNRSDSYSLWRGYETIPRIEVVGGKIGFIIKTIIIEVLKYFVVVPIALFSLVFHLRTMKKYKTLAFLESR